MPNDLTNIDNFSESDGFIIGIKGFSWFIPYEITVDELKDIVPKVKEKNKKIFISLNKLMYNQDIPLLKEYLLVIDKFNIDGIIYDDLSILKISKELGINTPLVWFGIHSFTNHFTANYWYTKGVKTGILSTEITLDHIKEIRSNTDMRMMMYGYGYLPMFVSSRPLISSYFKYIKKDKKNITYNMYEEQRKLSYPTYEKENGTIILSSDIINTIDELPELNNTIDYLILSSLNIPSNSFNKIYSHYIESLSYLDNKTILKSISNKVKEDSTSRTDKGFLYKETVYRVKNDGER
jgi:putative protease